MSPKQISIDAAAAEVDVSTEKPRDRTKRRRI